MEPLLTIPEVAELLKTSERTVKREIDDGNLKAIRVRRSERVRKSDLESYVNQD